MLLPLTWLWNIVLITFSSHAYWAAALIAQICCRRLLCIYSKSSSRNKSNEIIVRGRWNKESQWGLEQGLINSGRASGIWSQNHITSYDGGVIIRKEPASRELLTPKRACSGTLRRPQPKSCARWSGRPTSLSSTRGWMTFSCMYVQKCIL